MECLPVTNLPDGSDWSFEIKLDGYRALAVKAASKVKLYSRRKKSFNSQYPYLVEALSGRPEETVVEWAGSPLPEMQDDTLDPTGSRTPLDIHNWSALVSVSILID